VGSGSRRLFWRNLDAGELLESFLVAATVAVLAIRAGLAATGYPTLGGDSLHVAHMLWGGLLMLVALLLAFYFVTRSALRLAAVLGGFGFGTFIDEVGKFLTHDNDYFFEPAVAIIYATFILTVLVARTIQARRTYEPTEYLLNAVRELEEVAADDLDPDERRRALARLEHADPDHALTRALRQWLSEAATVPRAEPGILARWRRRADAWYRAVSGTRTFVRVVDVFFLAQLALRVFYVTALITGVSFGPLAWLSLQAPRSLGAIDVIQIVALVASGVATLHGVVWLPRSRPRAYRSFRRSLLITILVTQVFAFAQHQLSALIGLVGNLLVLRAVDLALEREEMRSR